MMTLNIVPILLLIIPLMNAMAVPQTIPAHGPDRLVTPHTLSDLQRTLYTMIRDNPRLVDRLQLQLHRGEERRTEKVGVEPWISHGRPQINTDKGGKNRKSKSRSHKMRLHRIG